ncbi:MAG: hypothetical protein FWH55_10580 [Oscillospiraceae bacterium]|nr:hypothetical protein [Oscillospiraceae bacterium]
MINGYFWNTPFWEQPIELLREGEEQAMTREIFELSDEELVHLFRTVLWI